MSEPRSQDFFPFQSAEARERFLARYAEQEADWPVPFEGRVVTSDHGETFVRISGPVEATPLSSCFRARRLRHWHGNG